MNQILTVVQYVITSSNISSELIKPDFAEIVSTDFYSTQWNSVFVLPTPWRRALLDKLIVPQLVRTFYGSRRLIAIFTTAYYWSLTWAIQIQSMPSHLFKTHFNIILSSMPNLQSSLFPSCLPIHSTYTKNPILQFHHRGKMYKSCSIIRMTQWRMIRVLFCRKKLIFYDIMEIQNKN